MTRSLRTLMIAGAMLASAVSASTAAIAQTFTFVGSAAGCFGANCSPGALSVDDKLTYRGSSFNVTTSNGTASIGSAPGTPNVNNLGSFSLANGTANYIGDVFKLAVTFTMPVGTNPNPGTYNAILSGTVTGNNGSASINFTTTSANFTFPGGMFTLTVPSFVSVTPGNTIALSGNIVATPGPIAGAGIPALLAFAGLFGFRRWLAKGAATA